MPGPAWHIRVPLGMRSWPVQGSSYLEAGPWPGTRVDFLAGVLIQGAPGSAAV